MMFLILKLTLNKIDLKFIIDLKEYSEDSSYNQGGLVFHQFLPENQKDKIVKNISEFDGEISFWFERRLKLINKGGPTEKVFYDHKSKSELEDESIINEQSHIQVRFLFGSLTINNLPKSTLNIIMNDEVENEKYVEMGKKIVKTIYSHSNDLINLFKNLFRQYWIQNLEKWDSRTKSLSTYCKDSLYLKYSIDNGKNWKFFEPDKHEDTILGGTPRGPSIYLEYISKVEWNSIKELYKKSFKPSIISELISNAHKASSKGDLQKAFIIAVTAVELSIPHKLNSNFKINKRIKPEIQSFNQIPLKSKLGIVALSINKINSELIENAFKSLDIRNKIVHKNMSQRKMKKTYYTNY